MRLTSAWVVALGVAAIALPAVVACRGVLGIHALGYDGGASDAREDVHETEDAPSGDDGASESGPSDTGVDTGHAVDTGADAPKDAGVDHEGDAHEAGPVDAGKDAPKDSAHDTRPPPPDASYDGCVNSCITMIDQTAPNEIGGLIADCPGNCQCTGCDTICNGGTCSNPGNESLACEACLLECIRAGAMVNACGMALMTCGSSGSGCQMLGGCLNNCTPP